MSVRVRTSRNSPGKPVQTVGSFREGRKVRQRIVPHVGAAMDGEEEATPRKLARHIRARMPHGRRPGPLPPGQVAEAAIGAGRRGGNGPLPVGDPGRLRGEHRTISGIHGVHGRIHREPGLDPVLPAGRRRMPSRVLYHTVMARTANPDSRRASVRRLERDLGVHVPLEKVCRMMDRPGDAAIAGMRERVGARTRPLFPGPVGLVPFDCTTPFLGSACEDTPPAYGHSRDGRHGEVRVLLALAVTHGGLPLGHGVFPGNSREGDSSIPTPRTMRPGTARAVTVAGAGMFGRDSLAGLGAPGCRFAVGARLRNLPKALTGRVPDVSRYRSVPGSDLKVGVFRHGGRRLVVPWSARRARRDAHDRRSAVARLVRRPGKGGTPKRLPGRSGYHRHVRVVGEASLEVDGEKVHAAGRRDGLHGVVTSPGGVGVREPFDRHRRLRQVGEGFRITRHGLRVRPVSHWTDRRIRAHPAIAFMAHACVRHPARRVTLQERPMSPRVIRGAPNDRQCPVPHDPGNGRRYVIPPRPGAEAKDIHATPGLDVPDRPYGLTADGTETESARA